MLQITYVRWLKAFCMRCDVVFDVIPVLLLQRTCRKQLYQKESCSPARCCFFWTTRSVDENHCEIVLVKNSLCLQTLDSQWVAHEVHVARAYGIPIICVVDGDKQLQREVIDHYMEKGFGASSIISLRWTIADIYLIYIHYLDPHCVVNVGILSCSGG